MPRINGMLSGQPVPYRILPLSVQRFVSPQELAATMQAAGLKGVSCRLLALGTVALHVGERSAS
jgi:ubiquinone/menaquinone biosynthesis C-methylase UbiE